MKLPQDHSQELLPDLEEKKNLKKNKTAQLVFNNGKDIHR